MIFKKNYLYILLGNDLLIDCWPTPGLTYARQVHRSFTPPGLSQTSKASTSYATK